MTPQQLNRRIATELEAVVNVGLITAAERARIAERYPTTPWDVRVLIRWLTLFGAVAMAAGLVLLSRELVSWENLLDGGLAVGAAVALALGLRWRTSRPATASALLLGAGLAFQGFTFSFADHHPSGSDNWPALLGVGDIVLLLLAYGTRTRLNLVHACITFFLWFGGSTGYMSGWGMYWLGLTYPLRFLGVGVLVLGVAWVHQQYLRGEYQAFSRVWAHFGMVTINLALWFLSLFGVYGEHVSWEDEEGARVGFTALWIVISAASMFAGNRFGMRMLRGYGLTFLLINVYTAYFQFIAYRSAGLWFVHLLLVGGTLVGLGVLLDGQRKKASA